jgi:predicted nucleic acid-binding protein
MSVVVDANVLIALVVADEHQAAASEHLTSWLDADEELYAPAVLPYEIANVLARLVFEETLAPDEVPAIWEDLAAFDLHLHPFDFTADGPAVATITAQLHRRHATDSTYVRLAQSLETTLWTLDGGLARNAADVGLPVRLIS